MSAAAPSTKPATAPAPSCSDRNAPSAPPLRPTRSNASTLARGKSPLTPAVNAIPPTAAAGTQGNTAHATPHRPRTRPVIRAAWTGPWRSASDPETSLAGIDKTRPIARNAAARASETPQTVTAKTGKNETVAYWEMPPTTPTAVGMPSTSRRPANRLPSASLRGASLIGHTPTAATTASPAPIANETRQSRRVPRAASPAARVSPPEKNTPNTPIANPRRFGPANSPIDMIAAGYSNPAPVPSRIWAPKNCHGADASAPATPPSVLATSASTITRFAARNRSSRPEARFAAAMENASTANATPAPARSRPSSGAATG